MKLVNIIGLITCVMLIGIGCSNSVSSKKSDTQAITDDLVEESSKYEPNDYYNGGLKLIRANGKIGFLNKNGEDLFPCIFDSIVDVQNDGYEMVDGKSVRTHIGYFTYGSDNRYAKVKKDGKWGLITTSGKFAISCIYDEIYDFDWTKTSRMEGPYIDFLDSEGGVAVVKKNGKWGLVNAKGEIIADCIYEDLFIPDVRLFYNELAAAKKDGLWGFINIKGKTITPFIYEAVGSADFDNPQFTFTFSSELAVVKKNGKWGVIDTKGNERISFLYDYISNFHQELSTIAQRDGKWGYINKEGKILIPLIYDDIKWFEKGLCPAKKGGLWGFLNQKGEIIVPMMYDDILVFDEVEVNGGLWFFSQDGYCAVKKNGKWGLIDKKNTPIVDFEYEGIKFTSSGLGDWRYFSQESRFLSVQKGKFWSVINKNGLNHIPFEYDDVEIWSEGNVCVKKNGKWGLVDSLGKQLISIEHKSASEAGNYHYCSRTSN